MRGLISPALAVLAAAAALVACASPSAPPRAPELSSYALVVTFVSIGQGTDPDAERDFQALVERYERAHGVRLAVKRADWGKEGEEDFCYPLGELSPADRAELLRDVRARFSGNRLVELSENAPCHESKNR